MKKSEIKTILENAGLYLPSSMLSIAADSKTIKGQKQGFLTGILYLIPDYALCPASKVAGCDIACLVSAGRGRFNSVYNGRLNKTKIFRQFPEIFYQLIREDIAKLKRKADKVGMGYCVRLNGTSDIDHTDFIASMPDVQFYDYTKMHERIGKAKALPNYHLTFSYSGLPRFHKHNENAKNHGLNLAVVFNGKLPAEFFGLPVINGDDTDLRFLDKEVFSGQCIVGLTAKGKAKQDKTGFVVPSNLIAIG